MSKQLKASEVGEQRPPGKSCRISMTCSPPFRPPSGRARCLHDDPARTRWASEDGPMAQRRTDKGHAKPAGERSGPGNRFAKISPIRGADTSSNQPIMAQRGAIQARAAVAMMTA